MEISEKPQRNFRTGQFLKGHTPFNKGKSWDEWMDGRKQRKVKRIAKLNLRPNMDIGGWNKKKCVGVNEEGRYKVYASLTIAAESTGALRENIKQTCQGKRKRAAGIYWYYADDDGWIDKVRAIKAEKERKAQEYEATRESREYKEMIRERALGNRRAE